MIFRSSHLAIFFIVLSIASEFDSDIPPPSISSGLYLDIPPPSVLCSAMSRRVGVLCSALSMPRKILRIIPTASRGYFPSNIPSNIAYSHQISHISSEKFAYLRKKHYLCTVIYLIGPTVSRRSTDSQG